MNIDKFLKSGITLIMLMFLFSTDANAQCKSDLFKWYSSNAVGSDTVVYVSHHKKGNYHKKKLKIKGKCFRYSADGIRIRAKYNFIRVGEWNYYRNDEENSIEKTIYYDGSGKQVNVVYHKKKD